MKSEKTDSGDIHRSENKGNLSISDFYKMGIFDGMVGELVGVNSDRSEHPHIAYCIAAERALQHAGNNSSSVAEIFDRRGIQQSKYVVLAGFDESVIESED